ncbi:unnamed protein product, partial [marine sediment metagenome]
CLFFSVNSCVNIKSVPRLKRTWNYLSKLFKKEILYDKSQLDIGIFSKKLLGNFINEVKAKIENYDSSKKFILLHHPIFFLEKRPNKKIFLEQNEIYGVFSGHFHNYDYKIDGKLHNFLAGSILVSNKKSKNFVPFTSAPPQFNLYEFNFIKNRITQFIYKLDAHDGNWNIENNKTINYYLNPEYLNAIFQFEDNIKYLEIAYNKLEQIFNDLFLNSSERVTFDQLSSFLQEVYNDGILEDYINEEDFSDLEEEYRNDFCRYAVQKEIINDDFLSYPIPTIQQTLDNAQRGLKELIKIQSKKIFKDISLIEG